MTESEPPPPPAPPPPNDEFPSSLFSSLLEDEEEDHEGLISWCQLEDPHQHVNWKQRYYQLKVNLARFRMETAELQQSLQEKLSELEQKAAEADRRSNEARQKMQVMEQKLQSLGVSGDTFQDCMANADQACKDQIISNLEQQVEEQKKLRILDAKKVEAKASKIKEWVTNKLKELEEQNYQLREENKKCNAQLELLKKRLSQMSQQKEKNNTEDSSRGSWEDQGSSDDAPPLTSITSANQRANYINNNEPSFNSSPSTVEGNKKSSSWASTQQARVDQWIDSSCQVSLTRRSESEDSNTIHAMGSEPVEAGLPPIVPLHSTNSPFPQMANSRSTSETRKPTSKKQHSRSLPRETTRNSSSLHIADIP
ncbi:leucine zipper putative tumor suppressor 2-like, partial [Stegodyphus dumicola]|uniref:leucine zipper putative tumor suppressor 2-like n=1 Tax=Stegodyphus dumicola TaxID=202533 RepID=UPI0015AF55B4